MAASNSYQEPTLEEVDRWSKIFTYPVSEAPNIITQFRADINRQRLTDGQWHIIRVDKEAERYDRETYEHWLQVWSTKPKTSKQPRASDDKAFFVFKLQAAFPDIGSLQSKVGISATLKKGLVEEGDADFPCVTGAAKRAIEVWIETQSPRPPPPGPHSSVFRCLRKIFLTIQATRL